MSIRRLIVEVDLDGLNVTRFCKQHCVSTWFFYELRRRHARGEPIEARSRAPHRVANRTAGDVEDLIVALRKELDEVGAEAGPASIWWHLQQRTGAAPSESTIWRVLKARGLIVPEPAKAPKRALRRFVAERANECWQLDDTSWELGDGTEVKILNILDDHSRLAVASVAYEAVDGTAALEAFVAAAAIVGWPARFLSDNAGAFRFVLAEALAEIGVGAAHSRPYHPQTQGKVERFHQTLKRWLDRQPRAATRTALQSQLDVFRHYYNHERPHRSLERRFPGDVWTAAPKTGPSDRPLGTASRIYTGIVNGGCVRLGDKWRISIGAVHNNQRALAVVTGTACHVFVNARLARALTLTPGRVDQPLHNRPGRPPLP